MKSRVRQEIQKRAEADLSFFINLVHPQTVLGIVHTDLIAWMTRQEANTHQLVLLPRDHQKSRMAGYRVAWEIVKNPAIRVLYISSTSNLAEKQLKFIKDILTSKAVSTYWPTLVHPEEGKREKWTNSEISVDHPLRKAETIRDPTVFTAGLTTSITGLHCDLSVFDDVVVYDNAYTEEGRSKVRSQYSLLASIEGAEARQLVVGTRYHPKDLYNTMAETVFETYDENGDITATKSLYEVYERQVEDRGDGTGSFLWPRQLVKGKWFGFNADVLSRKRAQYVDRTQFRAQYYNDPNSLDDAPVPPDRFQYYDDSKLTGTGGNFSYGNSRLNVFAAVDFAYTTGRNSDYTAIVVIGVDAELNYYVLEIARFKTDRISEYFSHILRLHEKWSFRKLRAEVTAAQSVIVKDLKDNYIRPYGLLMSVDEFRPPAKVGGKQERIMAVLQPKYDNLQIFHPKTGFTQVLEEELSSRAPAHDDVIDALANAIDVSVPPAKSQGHRGKSNVVSFHSRFGGIR